MPGVLLDMEAPVPPPEEEPEYGFVVSHQKVEILDVDFTTQSIRGQTEITILPQSKDLRNINLDARQCVIPNNGIRINGVLSEFEFEDPMQALRIPLTRIWDGKQYGMQRERIAPLTSMKKADCSTSISVPRHIRIEETDPFSESATNPVMSRLAGGARACSNALDESGNTLSAITATPKTTIEQGGRFQPLIISIQFSVKNFRDGLHFVGVSEGDTRWPHLYTRHTMDPGTSSCIFPCVDDSTMRCTWEVSFKCYRTLGDTLKRRSRPHHGNGVKRDLANGTAAHLEEYEAQLSDEEKLSEMIVICSGELMNEISDLEDSSKKIVSFRCNTMVAPQHIAFAIGPFEQVDLSEFRDVADDEKLGQAQTIPVTGYCLPGRTDEVRHTCTPMANALDHFLLQFGSFPFTECRVVFVDDQIADVEHAASLSICSARMLIREDIIDPEVDIVRKLVHAIASQYIGIGIVPAARSDRWATVGLSHFMTDTYMRVLCGHNEASFRQKTLSDRVVELDVDRPSLFAIGEVVHLGAFELEFMALKAPLVLAILDKRIQKNSSSTSTGITRVLSKMITNANTGLSMADSEVSTDSFRRLIEKLTKYRQLDSFWNQWILGAGCPKFVISQKFNKKRLVIEMTISQKQDTAPTLRTLEKESFMREIKEDIHGVYAAGIQPVFTGPITIRIHEADGTPYEHVVELREGHQKFEIPYNTKYKRLKRSRRQKERMAGHGHGQDHDDGGEALYYCLGDVLQGANEVREWGLQDWDAETEQRMDQESYEWIRIDADFEWIAEKQFMSMPAYMYVSQLQQDRDVVAQQDSMLYLGNMNAHPLVATFLVRTLMDERYFHGIRTMAAEYLKTHATAICNWVGLKHLEKAYQSFFCYDGGKTPKPNDFSDKRAYKVEMAIVKSLSQIRDVHGRCPREPRQFLYDILTFNDNDKNEFSDEFKLANLLSCLTDSVIPVVDANNVLKFNDEDEDGNTELEDFTEAVVKELDRYRRSDEWVNSYHNIFTTTVLDCKKRLMKAKIIPMDAQEFAIYLHDASSDHIRITAFKSLIELGFITTHAVAAFLLNVLSTDSSPFVRNKLFEVLCLGLASVAFGEHKPADAGQASQVNKNGTSDKSDGTIPMDIDGEHDGGLIIEQEASLDLRKAHIARTTTIEGALAALKKELQDNQSFKAALWEAVKSSMIGVHEQIDLLDICFILFDPVESLTLRLRLPRFWAARYLGKGVIHFKETNKVRTKSLRPPPPPPAPVPVAPAAPKPTMLRISVNNGTPAPASIPGSTIVAQPPVVKPPAAKAAGPKLAIARTPLGPSLSPSPTPAPKPPTKIVFGGSMKPPKRPAPDSVNGIEGEARPRKLLKLKVKGSHLERIESLPPNPAPYYRAKSSSVKSTSTKSSSPSSRPSPAPRTSMTPGPAPHSSYNNSNGGSMPPAPSSASSTPKPARKPLPGSSARTPLPDKTPRTPLPGTSASERKPLPVGPTAAPSEAAPSSAPPKKMIIKLKMPNKALPLPPSPSLN